MTDGPFGRNASALLCAIQLTLVLVVSRAEGEIRPTIDVSAVRGQFANVPVIFSITVTSSLKDDLGFSAPLGETVPNARYFLATIVDSKSGRTIESRLTNQLPRDGSSSGISIFDPLTFPAALDPLPPGEYLISVECNMPHWPPMKTVKPIRLTVEADAGKEEDARKQFLRRAGEGDRFYKYVVYAYGIDPLLAFAVQGLLSEDEQTLETAITGLWQVRRLPPGGEETLIRAMRLHGKPIDTSWHHSLLEQFSELAGGIGTDGAIDALLVLAKNPHLSDEDRKAAISHLAKIQREQAGRELVGLLDENSDEIRWYAGFCLAERHNPAGIEPLLKVIRDSKDEVRRENSLSMLTEFLDRANVRAAFVAAASDPSPRMQGLARRALAASSTSQPIAPVKP